MILFGCILWVWANLGFGRNVFKHEYETHGFRNHLLSWWFIHSHAAVLEGKSLTWADFEIFTESRSWRWHRKHKVMMMTTTTTTTRRRRRMMMMMMMML